MSVCFRYYESIFSTLDLTAKKMAIKMAPTNPKDPMIPNWLAYIQEVNRKQEEVIMTGTTFSMPFVALSVSVVQAIQLIVEQFKLSPKTMYIAMSTFDKYMYTKFWEMYTKYGHNPDSRDWKYKIGSFSSRTRLRLMSCIQLASKIDSRGLQTCQVISALRLMDSLANEERQYTDRMVIQSEFSVFKTVGFTMPLVTPLDAVEILLAALELHKIPQLYSAALKVLNLTYLQHQPLYSYLQLAITGAKVKSKAEELNLMVMESDILLRSASVIACTLLFFNVTHRTFGHIIKKLVDLVGIQMKDIIEMAQVIFFLANPVEFVSK